MIFESSLWIVATNNQLVEKYQALAKQEKNVIFGGHLSEYKYYDMASLIERVLQMKIE